MIDVLETNRRKGHFQLHEFVVMPNHLHLLLTPAYEIPLERAIQFIKGGFSYRAKRELGFNGPIWQPSFTEHRIKDAEDYAKHREYVVQNPHRAGLARDYPSCSATGRYEVDDAPPALKRTSIDELVSRR